MHTFIQPISNLRLPLFAGVAGSCLLLSSGSALATTMIQPEMESHLVEGMSLMIVMNDETQVRCGDQDVFYAIGLLKANTRVQVAGVSGDYTRILLPKEIGALVPADEVDAALDGKTVTTVYDSKLRAPSHLLGMSGAWKGMYETPLKSGTTLEVLEILKSEDDSEVLGYRVVAPVGPEGELPVAYVKSNLLREASDAELRAFTNSGGETNPIEVPELTPTTEIDPSTDSSAQDTDIAPEGEESTDIIGSDDQATEMDDSLMEPMVTEEIDDEPVEIMNSAPVDVSDDDNQATSDEIQRVATGGQLSPAVLEDLEASFARARDLDRSELDDALSELHAEFTRAREQAEDGSSLAKALDQRIEWFNIRILSRDQRRSIAEALATYDANQDQIAQQIQEWQAGRAYQLVGRMTASSVYNGEQLALLYRVQIRDPQSGLERTIGYIAPKSGQDFRHMLGRVVGVIGSTHVDDALGLTVIEPERVDLMPE